MSKEYENRYKMCRELSGLTQEQAVEILHTSVRTLSDYENGHTRVADDIVAKMAELYNSPMLAWWHLKENSVLGRFLPEIVDPQSNGDMAFQVVLAQFEIDPAVDGIKKIMADGVIADDEKVEFKACMGKLDDASGKLMSAVAYARRIE